MLQLFEKKCLYLSLRQLRKTGDIEKSYYALTCKYVKKAHTFFVFIIIKNKTICQSVLNVVVN